MENDKMKFSQTYSTDLEHVALLRLIVDATGINKSETLNRLIEVEAERIRKIQDEEIQD